MCNTNNKNTKYKHPISEFIDTAHSQKQKQASRERENMILSQQRSDNNSLYSVIHRIQGGMKTNP